MVVGGFSNYKEDINPASGRCFKDPQTNQCFTKPGLINDVEIISLTPRTLKSCTKFANKVVGFSYAIGEDEAGNPIIENEAQALGLTGQFTKDAAIVCGGRNGDGDMELCFEWDSEINKYEAATDTIVILEQSLKYF